MNTEALTEQIRDFIETNGSQCTIDISSVHRSSAPEAAQMLTRVAETINIFCPGYRVEASYYDGKVYAKITPVEDWDDETDVERLVQLALAFGAEVRIGSTPHEAV